MLKRTARGKTIGMNVKNEFLGHLDLLVFRGNKLMEINSNGCFPGEWRK